VPVSVLEIALEEKFVSTDVEIVSCVAALKASAPN
jgi:hypothetical protein